MNYKIQCNNCHATTWVKGEYDPETNAIEITEDDPCDPSMWDGGVSGLFHECSHQNWEILM